MTEYPTGQYPTALGASSRETITLLGQDLARDVMGNVGFGELAFWLATQRRPEPGEVRVFEAVLAALADHGFTPTAIVTRLTWLSAPDSVLVVSIESDAPVDLTVELTTQLAVLRREAGQDAAELRFRMPSDVPPQAATTTGMLTPASNAKTFIMTS